MSALSASGSHRVSTGAVSCQPCQPYFRLAVASGLSRGCPPRCLSRREGPANSRSLLKWGPSRSRARDIQLYAARRLECASLQTWQRVASVNLWRVKGNVTNRSSHELSGFTLKIVVRDCLALGGSSCTTIGENEVSTHLIVPPNQTRAFEELVTLGDMPEPTKWGWTYAIQEVQGKVK
jgi:hypothetical protein